MFVELLIKKFFQSYSARTGFTPMHDAFVALRVVNSLLNQVFVCQVPVHCITSYITFWWVLQTQTQWVIFGLARTHHLSLKTQIFDDPIFTFACFSLKAVYNFCKLQDFCKILARILQVAKFLFMYSFTHTNIVFLFRHLPNEIIIFINVSYQTKCFSGDSFSFLRSRFC